MTRPTLLRLLAAAALLLAAATAAKGATPAEVLAGYVAKAGAPGSAERGQKLFNTSFGRDYDGCAACHGAVPTKDGKDLVSEKKIGPLAPAFNTARFTDAAKVEHNFRINCKDVIGRECTAQEKADVMTWLLSLKR